jgi:miniconductance mechanosensitive channel
MLITINKWFEMMGQSAVPNQVVIQLIALAIIVLSAYIANFIVKGIVLKAIKTVFKATKSNWDDIFLEKQVFHRMVNLVPALIIWRFVPEVFPSKVMTGSSFASTCQTVMLIVMLFIAIRTINAFFAAFEEIYDQFDISKRVPIKVFIQAIQIIQYIIAVIFFVSIVAAIQPAKILAGLGALTAVTMLVFKETILGFVAGIQLIVNDMVNEGDWIEMPAYGADGDVIDISLMTIKVQNWDKTISTIPTSALTTNSFKNWRGMSDSGGRRIKRAISIDMNTIKFCNSDMLNRFKNIEYISQYIDQKQDDVTKFNVDNKIDETNLVNGRRLTNIGTFRAYCLAYLKNHPKIHKEMTFMVRQLAPTESGVPIEIYVFSKEQDWVVFEDIQAGIFDHLLAVIPEFDLKVFQKLNNIQIVK